MVTNVRQVTPWDFPEVPGYMTVKQVAALYGMSRENIFYKIYTQRRFQKVYRVGKDMDETERPMLLLDEAEVRAVHARDTARETAATFEQLLNAFNKRVKAWGREHDWHSATGTPVRVHGAPHRELVEAYLRAHPDDPEPKRAEEAEDRCISSSVTQ